MAFFVHPDNPLKQLTFDQIDAIYSTTRHRGGQPITTWGQLGLTGEWADKPIHVWGVKPWNGFEEFIRQRALSVGRQARRMAPRHQFHRDGLPALSRRRRRPLRPRLLRPGLHRRQREAPRPRPAGGRPGGYAGTMMKSAPPATRSAGWCSSTPTSAPASRSSRLLEEFLKFILSREGQQIILDQAVFLPLRAGQAATSRAMLQ